MRNTLFALLLSLFCVEAFAQKNSIITRAQNAHKNGFYFTASSYLKHYLLKSGESTPAVGKLLDRVIENTNVFPFLELPFDRLKNITNSRHIYYVIGKKYFFKKDYKNAIFYFNQVATNSPFYLQALNHLAGLYEVIGEVPSAEKFAQKCIKESLGIKNILPLRSEDNDQKLEFIKDSCEIIIARAQYKNTKFPASTKLYNRIPLNSYKFPDSLFENSWNYFITRDFNRAVGKNLTFQAPVLENYFLPETELVKALSYVELCNWDEALAVMKNFDTNVKSKANDFMTKFNLKNQNTYSFVNLLLRKEDRNNLGDNFFKKMTEVIFLKPGFKTIEFYLRQVQKEKELMLIKRADKTDAKAYNMAYRDFAKFFNNFVKVKFVGFAQDIIRISNIFTEMELDLYSSMKYQLYDKADKKKSAPTPTKFFIKDLDRNVDQHSWNFHGEFWADELGSYIPLLENKCKGAKTIEK